MDVFLLSVVQGHCSRSSVSLPESLLFVSTLDGNLHAVCKRSGSIKWTLKEGKHILTNKNESLFLPPAFNNVHNHLHYPEHMCRQLEMEEGKPESRSFGWNPEPLIGFRNNVFGFLVHVLPTSQLPNYLDQLYK